MKFRLLFLIVPAALACGPFFYQAPPPLTAYLERVPTKSWTQMLENDSPKGPDTKDTLVLEIREWLDGAFDLSDPDTGEKIDDLLSRNRHGEFSIALANFLLEFRELAESDTPDEASKDYLDWRFRQIGTPPLPTHPHKGWNESENDFAIRVTNFEEKLSERLAIHEERIASSPHELRPNELVQRGGRFFKSRYFQKAEDDFQTVMAAFPDHPRAEVARFMHARCALSKARAIGPAAQDKDPEMAQAHRGLLTTTNERLNTYLATHPDGRFVGDALGWLGAVRADGGDIEGAVNYQLRRLEHQSTRETTRSVLRECDQLFAQLIHNAADNEASGHSQQRLHQLDFQGIARQPLVARLLLQHCIDPATQADLPILDRNLAGDRRTLDFLRRRIFVPGPYVKSVLARFGDALVAENLTSDDTSLLILGWAGTRNGDHAQALALFDRASDSDEIVHARAIVLSRLGRFRESAEAYQKLIGSYPESPLAPPSRFDLAIALQRSGQAGQAWLELVSLDRLFTSDPWNHEKKNGLDLHPENETIQWIDSIAQFSPVNELEAALNEVEDPSDPRIAALRAIVRSRALAAGDFALASRHLDQGSEPPFPVLSSAKTPWNAARNLHLTDKRWDVEVSEIAATSSELAINPDDAALHLKHARQWEALRGKLTLPLHGICDYSASESEKIDQLRRTNARFLGFSDARVTAELDSRDELHHALRHYLATAEISTDPDIVAPALFAANEALFRLAEFSLYAASRAAEENHSLLSAQLVDRLRSEFPERPEAKRAIAFHFVPPTLLGPWMPGDTNMWMGDQGIADEIAKSLETPAEGRKELAEELRSVKDTLEFLQDQPATLDQIRERLATARSTLDQLRPRAGSSELVTLIDDLDDLDAAASSPGVTPELFKEYARIRLTRAPVPEIDGRWQPLAASLDFLDRIRRITFPDGWERQKADTIDSWRSYLAKYPDSPKSEAASLRMIRLRVRASCPIPHVRPFHFPAAPIANGYKRLVANEATAAFNETLLASGIADHRSKYPAKRYDADLKLLEAAVAARAENYELSLRNLSDVLLDPRHPELRQDAALYFSELCLRLLEPEQRPTLVPAFTRNPQALDLLKHLANGDTCVSRLRPLIPSLRP